MQLIGGRQDAAELPAPANPSMPASAASRRRFFLGTADPKEAWWLGGVLVLAAVSFALAALSPPYEGDMRHFKMWTRTVTLEGIQNAYNGSWPDTFSIYPPITMATFWTAGQVYRLLADPAFALEPAMASPLLSYLLKLPGVVFHLMTGFAIYRIAIVRCRFRAALVAAAVYLFHPAAFADLAYWGHPDSVYAFFLVLAAGGLAMGGLALGWGALAAAALAKPQAWSQGPLLAAAGLAWSPYGTWPRGVAAALAVVALVLAPFALDGRLAQLASLPAEIGKAHPVISANAHNLWWLAYGGSPAIHTEDIQPLLLSPMLITPRRIGYGLWALASVLAIAMVLRAKQRTAVYEAAAFVALAFVMVATRIHENHGFMVLPLGALAAVHRPWLWTIWSGFSVVILLNLLLHDPRFIDWIGKEGDTAFIDAATPVNAAFASLLLLVWTGRMVAEIWSASADPLPRV